MADTGSGDGRPPDGLARVFGAARAKQRGASGTAGKFTSVNHRPKTTHTMSGQLFLTEALVEGKETTVWRLDHGNERVVIHLNRSLNNPRDRVTACEWPSEGYRFVRVQSSDWDSNELVAITNGQGKIIRKGICSVAEGLDQPQRFIVRCRGRR